MGTTSETHKVYYYLNRLLSNTWAYFYIAIGSRGRGKTTSAWRWVLKRFINNKEKFAWLRLTEAPLKKMSRNRGQTLVSKVVLEELHIAEVKLKGTLVYIRMKGEQTFRECGVVDALSTFYTTKGEDLSAYTNIVVDEINRETSEHNTFDLVDAFIKQVETIARLRKNVRVLMLGNTIYDTSEILSIFKFQPYEFGVYKLKRRHCVIEYLEDSPEWLEKRKDSLAGALVDSTEENNSAFTNISNVNYDTIKQFNNRYRPVFILNINNNYRVEFYSVNDTEGGMLIDKVRDEKKPEYKVSPFLTCSGFYDSGLMADIKELLSANKIYWTNTLSRNRFIVDFKKALVLK